jgi:hypothetical protein
MHLFVFCLTPWMRWPICAGKGKGDKETAAIATLA